MSRRYSHQDHTVSLLEDETVLEPHMRSSINGQMDKPKGWGQWLLNKIFKGDAKVALYAIGLLIASTGNSIFFKKMTNKMQNYPYFLSQLTTAVYLPIFFGIVLYEFKFTNFITPAMTAFPKKKFLFMGLFDALSGICMLFGGIHTSGSFQALLLNAVIPFTMGLSILVLGTRYLKTQYFGAAIIMAGVTVVIIPQIVNGDSSDNSVIFNFIFLLATLPQAFSSIYKEIAFGDIDLDVNYLQAWVALFQFILGICLAPLNSLPFLDDAYVAIGDVPQALANGAKCLAGIDSVVNSTIIDPSGAAHGSCWVDKEFKWGAPADTHCDDCTGAWLPVMMYIIFNCAYNLFIVLVIKYGSAALLWIILTLRLPLVQIAFAIQFINDPPDNFKITSLIGLFVILTGLVMYRWSSVASVATPEEEEEGMHIQDEENLQSDSFSQRLTHASAAEF